MIFHNKFEFVLETVFSYTGAQQIFWKMLPTLVWNRQTMMRPRTFMLPHQDEHSEHYFSVNCVKLLF